MLVNHCQSLVTVSVPATVPWEKSMERVHISPFYPFSPKKEKSANVYHWGKKASIDLNLVKKMLP